MAILKSVTELEQLIKKSLEYKNQTIKSAIETIEKQNNLIRDIDSMMDKAAKEGDVKSYRELKQKKEDAVFTREVYERQLELLKNKPLITEDEYQQKKKAVFSEYDHASNQAKHELADLAEKMESISIRMNQAFSEANKALSVFQHDLYLDADRQKHPTTGLPFTSTDILQIRDTSAANWGKVGVESATYKDFKKQFPD